MMKALIRGALETLETRLQPARIEVEFDPDQIDYGDALTEKDGSRFIFTPRNC